MIDHTCTHSDTHTDTQEHAYTHTGTHTDTQEHMHTTIHTGARVCMHTHTLQRHGHMRTHTHTFSSTFVHTCMGACVHTQEHMCTHTQELVCTHTGAQVCAHTHSAGTPSPACCLLPAVGRRCPSCPTPPPSAHFEKRVLTGSSPLREAALRHGDSCGLMVLRTWLSCHWEGSPRTPGTPSVTSSDSQEPAFPKTGRLEP